MVMKHRGTTRRVGDDAESAGAPSLKRLKPTSPEPTISKRLSHRDYTIGWISAIFVEFAAAQVLLDEVHEALPQEPGDDNRYVLGQIGNFNIVIACLGDMGLCSAAIVSSNMVRTFTSIRLQLVVGVAGGMPTPTNDVRLGDVVVGLTVIQHDFGKEIRDGQFQNTATVCTPPTRAKVAITALRAEYDVNGSRVPAILDALSERKPTMARYTTNASLTDKLYADDYEHPEGYDGCEFCDTSKCQIRPDRADSKPRIHFGTIASGNKVVKNARLRNELGQRYSALCLEMEGAALKGNDIPFLVIRGICDYADSHKNKQWQPYAAATAAACAAEFLSFLHPDASNILRETDAQNPPRESTQAVDLGQQQNKYQAILESLSFEQMDARQANIKSAHAKTCKWLLKKSEFKDWLNIDKTSEHHGLLWIKGNPGTGKSTLMKFVVGHFQRNKKGKILISFFFNARGDQMEKSCEGMYRSLLLQLLTQLPRLQHIFSAMHTRAATTGWSISTLQDLLQQAILGIEGESLVCCIDALDECNPSEVRDMVYFFEDLGVSAVTAQLDLHVCFASRHYPHITVRKALELILDGQEGHEQDITDYINDKLNIGTGKIVQTILKQLQEKANSIFMWVVLVVRILNEQADSGLGPAALQKEVGRIPQDLHALFRDILQRDDKERGKLLLCIQLILFAQRPLSPEEIYLAVSAGLGNNDAISKKWVSQDMNRERLRLFVLSSSKGLAEITKTKKPTVQFIHESVNDFFNWEDGMRIIWPDSHRDIRGLSHDQLKTICLRYISIGSNTPELPRGTDPYERAYLREAISVDYPFMGYAVESLLWHADRAQLCCVKQNDFLDAFAAQLQLWRKLHNRLKKDPRRHYSSDVSLLYLFAERDLANLIILSCTELSCLTEEQSLYGVPLLAALATNSFQAAQLFVNAIRAKSNDNESQDIPLSQVAFRGPHSKLARTYSYRLEDSPLWALAEHGNVTVFDTAYRHLRVSANMRRKGMDTLLCWAGHESIVTYLVQHGAVVDALNGDGRTGLCRARDAEIAACLIHNGANVDIRDSKGMTPLHYAVRDHGDAIMAELLLKSGAAMDIRDSKGS
ncbi:adenosylhomocysteine nucleosidase [Microdochium nivale]|nr:adenosylhomocysteine nucleosidase [Microdochium nivale]